MFKGALSVYKIGVSAQKFVDINQSRAEGEQCAFAESA